MKSILIGVGVLIVIALGILFYQWSDYLRADYGLWPDGVIYYRFEGAGWDKDVHRKLRIRKGMDEWEKWSCIKFIELTDPREGDIYCRLLLGVNSYSKRGYRKNSFMQLDKSRYSYYLILHELGHVIGLIHEHQRRDRDRHIKVHWKNIKLLSQHNFWMLAYSYLDLREHPYDFKSVMHYNCYAKSNNGKEALTPLNEKYKCGRDWSDPQVVSGVQITELDYMKVNSMYKEEACK